MNRQLILMRHAKSSWDDPDLGDHERPLNDRGERDCRRMGQLLLDQSWLPDLVVCSTAERAKRTWEGVVEATNWEGALSETYQLYLAHPERIIQVIQRHGDGHSRVLAVGHNPGLQQLVEAWTGQNGKFSTAAIAVLSFELANWHDLSLNQCPERFELWKPKQLTEL